MREFEEGKEGKNIYFSPYLIFWVLWESSWIPHILITHSFFLNLSPPFPSKLANKALKNLFEPFKTPFNTFFELS